MLLLCRFCSCRRGCCRLRRTHCFTNGMHHGNIRIMFKTVKLLTEPMCTLCTQMNRANIRTIWFVTFVLAIKFGWSAKQTRIAASTFVDTHFTTDWRQQFLLALTLCCVGQHISTDEPYQPANHQSNSCDMPHNIYRIASERKDSSVVAAAAAVAATAAAAIVVVDSYTKSISLSNAWKSVHVSVHVTTSYTYTWIRTWKKRRMNKIPMFSCHTHAHTCVCVRVCELSYRNFPDDIFRRKIRVFCSFCRLPDRNSKAVTLRLHKSRHSGATGMSMRIGAFVLPFSMRCCFVVPDLCAVSRRVVFHRRASTSSS